MKISEMLSRLFFPDAGLCPVCEKEGAYGICENCRKELMRLKTEDERAVFEYEGVIRRIVLGYKFNKKRYLSSLIAQLMTDGLPEADFITNVPVHKRRRNERGYDQSEFIAKELAKITGIPYITSLEKTVNTKPQSSLGMEERKRNAEGVYRLKTEKDISGKTVLLIDDVITTGATMEQCALILEKAGAKVKPYAFALSTDKN